MFNGDSHVRETIYCLGVGVDAKDHEKNDPEGFPVGADPIKMNSNHSKMWVDTEVIRT
jgi:hypothetical protein